MNTRTSKVERDRTGAVSLVIDDNGQAHTGHCSWQASSTLLEELESEGVTDIKAEWGVTEDACLATWLSDGTVTCCCDD
jgi:hypothetical protein